MKKFLFLIVALGISLLSYAQSSNRIPAKGFAYFATDAGIFTITSLRAPLSATTMCRLKSSMPVFAIATFTLPTISRQKEENRLC